MGTRRKFGQEFKLEAVKMVKERGVALSLPTPQDLELNENMLRRWILEFSEDLQDVFLGLGHMMPEQAKIARLQGSIAKLKMGHEILKKGRSVLLKGFDVRCVSLQNTEVRDRWSLCVRRSVCLEVGSNAWLARPRSSRSLADEAVGARVGYAGGNYRQIAVSTRAIADNVRDRQFQADAPNQKWVADFTITWTAEC